MVNPKLGRNVPCPCGSGKKFKKCCLVAKVTGSGRQYIKVPAAQILEKRGVRFIKPNPPVVQPQATPPVA